jgi:hypothetical protein
MLKHPVETAPTYPAQSQKTSNVDPCDQAFETLQSMLLKLRRII